MPIRASTTEATHQTAAQNDVPKLKRPRAKPSPTKQVMTWWNRLREPHPGDEPYHRPVKTE